MTLPTSFSLGLDEHLCAYDLLGAFHCMLDTVHLWSFCRLGTDTESPTLIFNVNYFSFVSVTISSVSFVFRDQKEATVLTFWRG